jgi:uncharacterized protein YndB with AHSA1/START domain
VQADAVTASVLVEAQPEAVYEYFTRADAMVLWMGQYASLEARPGGEFAVDINGTPVRGRYLELEPPGRLLISWGFAGSDSLPAGASILEVLLTAQDGGTRVEIIHRGLPPAEVANHSRGWQRYLGRLATRTAGSQGASGITSSATVIGDVS